MGVLEDLSRVADRTARDIGDAIQNFGQDAQASLNAATKNVAALTGSGVDSRGRITGPLADVLGSDPVAFVLNLANKTRKASRQLLIRYAERTQKVAFTFNTPSGRRKVDAKPPSNAGANQIALTLILAAIDNPAVLTEEAGRMANGLPVKPRGLQGYTVYPLSTGGSPRGLFGIDDAILLGIVVPILAAIATAVLPALISAAGNIIKEVTGGGGPSPEEQAAAQAAVEEQKKKKTLVTVAVVAFVVLVGGGGLYLAMRKKGGAA